MSAEAPAPHAIAWLALGAAAGLVAAAVGLLAPGAGGDALPPNAAAAVNGEIIRLEEYDRALRALAADRRSPLGPAEREHVLSRLVDEELIVQRGLELGLAQLDRRVRADLVAAVIELVVAEADDAQPADAEVRAFYEENRGYFASAERLHVEQVLVRGAADDPAARERAERAAQRLRDGEPAARAAAELGDEPVAPLPRDLLPLAKLSEYLGPSAARRAASLEVGEVGGPERGAGGWRVLRLVDRRPGEAPPLDEIADEVRAELRRRGGDRALRAYLDELRRRADVRVRDVAAAAP